MIGRWVRLAGATQPLRVVMAALLLGAGALLRAEVEPSPVPSGIHPTLMPTSAIQVPLMLRADQISVWRRGQDQRALLTGHVVISVGYRVMSAESAAIWLTPSREIGENTYDAAIYLAGNVEVREGEGPRAAHTAGKELLVTTRIGQSVRYYGAEPANQPEEDNPVVKRGEELRGEVLARPSAPMFVPRVVITTAEAALQAGWIARGPGNRFVPGPGELQVIRDAHGNIILAGTPETRPAKPRPDVLVAAEDATSWVAQEIGNETVAVLRRPYVQCDFHDGRPPLDFRAQNVVLFMPKLEEAGSRPSATGPATRPAGGLMGQISTYITGAYLEGDVMLDQGDQLMVRAERVYFDFTTQRAIMLDATLATVDEQRNVPLYMRAEEIRQLARGEYAAKKTTFSISEFHTPHYHIGASDVYLQDVTPLEGAEMAGGGGSGIGQRTFVFKAQDATINIGGVPVFYWPYLGGDTSKNDIPLKMLRVGNSRTYGLSLQTDWSLPGLLGQPDPPGTTTDLHLDYFRKRGPAGGVDSSWKGDDYQGLLRSYVMQDEGNDRLGRIRNDIPPTQEARGRFTLRDQHDLGNGLTLQLEGSYVSDPNFLEQFFQHEFDADKEHETSVYLKKQGPTDALSLLGKFSLFDFTSTADQVDDQFSTEKRPEVKYWRIGDSLLDVFTYYSESGIADVHANITAFTPDQLGLQPSFIGLPAAVVPLNQTFRDYYRTLGWTTSDVVRADTRQEIDLPLHLGDVTVTPYVTGRATWWDDAFPETTTGNSTTRLAGATGVRASLQFWRVYNDVDSLFWDVHRIRHIVEPQLNVFIAGKDQERKDLMPFDRDVEGMTRASGMQLSLHQRWQTKRGGEGHWRDVDWLVLDVQWNQFWNKDQAGLFFPTMPLRGFYFPSRPELSLVQNSVNANAVWRAGEWYRFLGESDYSLQDNRLEQAAAGVAVDQADNLSYFFGNRYIRALSTDEWTIALDYQLTRKYEIIASESYDFQLKNNILSSITLVRRMPRFVAAITVTYDANNGDTSIDFTAFPEGFSDVGFGNRARTGAVAAR